MGFQIILVHTVVGEVFCSQFLEKVKLTISSWAHWCGACNTTWVPLTRVPHISAASFSISRLHVPSPHLSVISHTVSNHNRASFFHTNFLCNDLFGFRESVRGILRKENSRLNLQLNASVLTFNLSFILIKFVVTDLFCCSFADSNDDSDRFAHRSISRFAPPYLCLPTSQVSQNSRVFSSVFCC